ncbi:MAG: hypothetical protein JWN52_967 [Actinomycetia bacterium]|nr:hypothetical protein [Actinomycetes bacterium]
MAAGQPQERTASVRLRSMLSRRHSSTVRRLLVVGGIAVAGWLLGSAGQAHADTAVPEPVAAVLPHTPFSPVVDGTGLAGNVLHGAPDRAPVHAQSVHSSTKTTSSAAPSSPAHSRGRTAGGTVSGALSATRVSAASVPHGAISDLAHTLVDPVLNLFGQGGIHGAATTVSDALFVRPPAIFQELPGKIKRAMAGLASAGSAASRTSPGVSWALWHREGAAAGSGDRRTADAVAAGTASGAPESTGSGRIVTRAAFSHPAPGPEFPRPMSPQSGGVSILSGTALTGAGLGHAIRPGAHARPTFVLPPVLGAVPPAVHAATDEPSLSPD